MISQMMYLIWMCRFVCEPKDQKKEMKDNYKYVRIAIRLTF